MFVSASNSAIATSSNCTKQELSAEHVSNTVSFWPT